eukprot:g6860.t1
MKQLRRLRSLSNNKADSPPDDVEENVSAATNRVITPRTPGGNANNSGSGKLEVLFPAPNKELSTTKRSLFLEHGGSGEDERGCLEAVTRFLAAITAASAADKEVLCLGALSNWSLFLIPLRDPSFIGGMLHGFKKAKQNISDRIVEIPLRSVVDVALVSGRERLQTFRSFQANSVSRPFRVVTTKKLTPDGETAVPGAAATRQCATTLDEGERHNFLLVGFEDVSRLRHFLVLACESWAIRTGGAFGGPATELLSCSPVAAQRYLAGVFEAMTGSLRNQVDAQAELMEDLANELILDAAVKEAFFFSGDIFEEIARRLDAGAATADAASAAAEDEVVHAQDGFERTATSRVRQRDDRREVLADAHLISAAAAVLDAAFFHSLQFPQRVGLVGRPKPTALPVVAENLFFVFCALRHRIGRQNCGVDGGGGTQRRDDLDGVYSAGDESLAGDGAQEAADSMVSWEDVSTVVLDRVVRALNGMSDVIRLFNIEHESLGLVRNLVGVRIGTNLRAGIHPAASDALAFLIRVNDRTVGLIEDLDLREKQRRRLEAERLLAQGPAAALSPATDQGKGKKRGVFARLASLSPGSRSRRSPTPPLTPPESPAHQSIAHSVTASDNNDGEGSGLQHLLGEGRGGAEATMSRQRRKTGTSRLGSHSPRGRRGGPLPPPVAVHDEQSPSRSFLGSAPVLLHSYAKLLNSLVCGSYNLRAAYFSSCEADLRNIGRKGGYLDMLAGLDGGTPRMIFGQTALFLHEILNECRL